MNAHTPKGALTALAVENMPVLQALAGGEAFASITELADYVGRDRSNLSKSLRKLAEEQLLDWPEDAKLPDLGDAGRQAVEAWARAEGEAGGGPVRTAPLHLLRPWPDQPRTHFGEPATPGGEPASIEEMAQSIAEKGILQPLVVWDRGDHYQVQIGERRRRGALLAYGRGLLPEGFEVPIIVSRLGEAEAFEAAVAENTQREDMHWMDEAKAFLRMAERGRSATEIIRITGTNRSKRSVQDYTKCARELSPEDVARCYLPETEPRHLSYVKARDLVGDKREKPALDLSPRLAMTLLEVIDAGGAAPLSGGTVRITRFHKPPVGGPLTELSQGRKLITFGFEGAEVVARTTLSDEVVRWLDQLAYRDDPKGALYKVRASAMGDIEAAAAERMGEYVTRELNRPKVEDAPPGPATPAEAAQPPEAVTPAPDPLTRSQRRILREISARSLHAHRYVGGYVRVPLAALEDPDYQAVYDAELTTHVQDHTRLKVATSRKGEDYLRQFEAMPTEGLSPNSCATPWLREDGGKPQSFGDALEIATERMREGQPPAQAFADLGPPEAAADTPPPPKPDTPSLPPMLGIVVVEVAHKISEDGIERGPGTWATEIMADWHRDARGNQLVQGHRMVAFMPMGARTLVALTRAGREWLEGAHGVRFDEAGRPALPDARLYELQAELAGAVPTDLVQIYTTPWLNPPAEDAAAGEQIGSAEGQPAPGCDPGAEPPGEDAEIPHYLRRLAGGGEPPAVAAPLTERDRAVSALAAATQQLVTYVRGLPTRSKPPAAAAVADQLALVEAALEAVKPFLSKEA